MAYLFDLLLSFNGRIGRKSWWLGLVIIFAASLVGTLVLHPEVFSLELEEPPPPSWPDTLWQIAWIVPATAITVKRFNDRDWPFWFGYAIGVMGLFLAVAPYLGLVIEPNGSGIELALFWIVAIVSLLTFIDNGFLRGTKGPNTYGPDPLGPSEQAA